MGNLETVLGGDDTIRRNFAKIEGLYVADEALDTRIDALEALGLTKRTRGKQDVTTVAAATGSATVTHGLGTTPHIVLVSSQNTSGAGLAVCGVSTVGATQFTIQISYNDGVARSITVSVGWEAIA